MKNYLIVLLCITVLELGGLAYYNNLITNQKLHGIENGVTTEGDTSKEETVAYKNLKKIYEGEVKLAAASEDGSFIAFTNATGELTIKETKEMKTVYQTKNHEDVTYIKWIRNDSLILGITEQRENSRDISIKTFNVSSSKERLIKTFDQLSATSVVKAITFSEFTNDVYVLVGNDSITRIYHYDTNGNLSTIEKNDRYVIDLAVSNTENMLYMEEKQDNTYNVYKKSTWGSLELIKSNARLLGVIDDMPYIGLTNDTGLVTSVYRYENNNLERVGDLLEPSKKTNIIVKEDGRIYVVSDSSYYDVEKGEKELYSAPGAAVTHGNAVIVDIKGVAYLVSMK
jgi:WD40 repeat protein